MHTICLSKNARRVTCTEATRATKTAAAEADTIMMDTDFAHDTVVEFVVSQWNIYIYYEVMVQLSVRLANFDVYTDIQAVVGKVFYRLL